MWAFLKRPVESVLALTLLLLLTPLLGVIALAIKLADRGPVLFVQTRAGRHGVPFRMYKFRTMIVDADNLLDERGNPTAVRVTPVGTILRRFSLDELPQLGNVVLGQMAIVGPRPVPVEYVARMSAGQKRRHEVRPGLTGLAQVTSRHQAKWSERIVLDLQYVDSLSFHTDLGLVLRTARALVAPGVLVDRGDSSKVDLG